MILKVARRSGWNSKRRLRRRQKTFQKKRTHTLRNQKQWSICLQCVMGLDLQGMQYEKPPVIMAGGFIMPIFRRDYGYT